MAPAPNPGPSASTLAAGFAGIGFWRQSAVVAPLLAALAIMYQTETDFGARTGFVLSWGILNFFFITLLRRPALSGALTLTLASTQLLGFLRIPPDWQVAANGVILIVVLAARILISRRSVK